METQFWMFKTVSDVDRSYRSHDGYDDILASKYSYDSNVANSKQVSSGDIAVLVDKEKILGFAKVSRIKSYKSEKIISRCPIEVCGNTNYEERKIKKPKYRCNKGHEFDEPKSDTVEITKYEAYYGGSFKKSTINIPRRILKKEYFVRTYNRNMSIQRLDERFFAVVDKSVLAALNQTSCYIGPNEGESVSEGLDEYIPNNEDNRDKVNKEIKARRGQQKFRNDLLKRYDEKCCVTGCTIKHLLEAAHIKPYRGINDNHPSNGLLLRTDIHTLFDLNMLGIHPEKLTIHLNKEVKKDKYEVLENKKLGGINLSKPNKETLELKWQRFKENL